MNNACVGNGCSRDSTLVERVWSQTHAVRRQSVRAKAYIRAAERVALLTEPIDTLIVQNRLQEIPGVGPAIAQVIIKLHETGTYPSLEKMRAEFPETLLEMLTIPGLRPDKILKLHSELGVSTLEELVAACLQDKLKGVRGLGPALQRNQVLPHARVSRK